jgi:hypothetical protein
MGTQETFVALMLKFVGLTFPLSIYWVQRICYAICRDATNSGTEFIWWNWKLTSLQIHCYAPILEFYLPCQLFFHENWILNFYSQNMNGKEQVRNSQKCLHIASVLRFHKINLKLLGLWVTSVGQNYIHVHNGESQSLENIGITMQWT